MILDKLLQWASSTRIWWVATRHLLCGTCHRDKISYKPFDANLLAFYFLLCGAEICFHLPRILIKTFSRVRLQGESGDHPVPILCNMPYDSKQRFSVFFAVTLYLMRFSALAITKNRLGAMDEPNLARNPTEYIYWCDSIWILDFVTAADGKKGSPLWLSCFYLYFVSYHLSRMEFLLLIRKISTCWKALNLDSG